MDGCLAFCGLILAIIIVWMCKTGYKKSRNKVHFYIVMNRDGTRSLWMGKPTRVGDYWRTNDKSILLCWYDNFGKFSLNINDYKDLTWEYKPVEVFLNLEDW